MTAEGGRLGLPPLIAIADGTGGIAVRVPDGDRRARSRRDRASSRGAARGSVRPARAPTRRARASRSPGTGSLPAPLRLAAARARRGDRGPARRAHRHRRRRAAEGHERRPHDRPRRCRPARPSASSPTARAASPPTDLVKGRTYRLTGIVGQRASRKGALDGYRLYLRDRADIVAVAQPAPARAPAPSGAPAATVADLDRRSRCPTARVVTIEAHRHRGRRACSTRAAAGSCVQDATGAIEVLLPTGATGAERRHAAPRHRRDRPRLGRAAHRGDGGRRRSARARRVAPRPWAARPAERDEWLLVRLSGTVAEGRAARRSLAGRDRRSPTARRRRSTARPAPGIPSTAIVAGRRITVTGIVKRPVPDRERPPLRGPAARRRRRRDRAGRRRQRRGDGSATSGSRAAAAHGRRRRAGAVDVTPDTDLATLARARRRSASGSAGSIARLADDGFDLDDGTALARVELRGDMAALLAAPARGRGRRRDRDRSSWSTARRSSSSTTTGTLVRVGSLGQALPIGGAAAAPSAAERPTAGRRRSPPTRPGSAPASRPTSLLALALADSALSRARRRSSGGASSGAGSGPRSSSGWRPSARRRGRARPIGRRSARPERRRERGLSVG